MKERKVNSTFNHPTLGTLKVVREGNSFSCEGCAFNTRERCTNDPDKWRTGQCASEERSDRIGVIFVNA